MEEKTTQYRCRMDQNNSGQIKAKDWSFAYIQISRALDMDLGTVKLTYQSMVK